MRSPWEVPPRFVDSFAPHTPPQAHRTLPPPLDPSNPPYIDPLRYLHSRSLWAHFGPKTQPFQQTCTRRTSSLRARAWLLPTRATPTSWPWWARQPGTTTSMLTGMASLEPSWRPVMRWGAGAAKPGAASCRGGGSVGVHHPSPACLAALLDRAFACQHCKMELLPASTARWS